MKPKEKILAADLLELASDEFCNHGCNDLDKSFFKNWTKEEKQTLSKEYHEWNGDPENDGGNIFYIGDSSLMSYLAYKLKNNKL